MKTFSDLFAKIDSTTKTTEKVAALVDYFQESDDVNKLWAIALFSGKHPPRIANSTELKSWAAEMAGVPLWLFEESYHVVGDLAETISKIIPSNEDDYAPRSLYDYIQGLQVHKGADATKRKQFITQCWAELSPEERFVFNKLTSGTFRVGVSDKLMRKAVSLFTGLHENEVAHKLMGNWNPDKISFTQLLFNRDVAIERSTPYPFHLAYGLDIPVQELGDVGEWQIEYKWDGIRCQFISRGGEVFVWSRGEELITDRFPELRYIASFLPENIVIDRELVGYRDGGILPFQQLQTRITRKQVTGRLLKEIPVVIYAYDLLEINGEDIRNKPLKERRKLLEMLVHGAACPGIILSTAVDVGDWQQVTETRALSRDMKSEGLMLKHKESIYEVGRKKGGWWKWKVDPMTIDAVMIYAMSGHGRRANLYTDYTFAVWNEQKELVPVAKAYSGLTDEEILWVDAWIRKNTLEKFGPVRKVTSELVFEIAFEGINKSGRHKSGFALRFPRILRIRKDKLAVDADTTDTLTGMMNQVQ